MTTILAKYSRCYGHEPRGGTVVTMLGEITDGPDTLLGHNVEIRFTKDEFRTMLDEWVEA